MAWYRKAAGQGHAKAQCSLGPIYGQGLSVPKSTAKDSLFLQKAESQVLSEALEILAKIEPVRPLAEL